jgi:hypothetical protein
MSGDAFQRARPGSELDIPATAWNACLDAAEAHRRNHNRNRGDAIRQFRQADIVRVRNDSGQPVARFGVLGINGVIVTPTASLPEFQSQVAVRGTTPGATHAGRFVVCLEPLAANQVGRAWVAGVCSVRVDVAGDDHHFCDVIAGDRTKLKTWPDGAARILYRESGGAGTKWCIVRLGDGDDPVRIGKTAGVWLKNSLASINLHEEGAPGGETPKSPPDTLPNCVNKFADVDADKWVVVARGPFRAWYLVWAEHDWQDVITNVSETSTELVFTRKRVQVIKPEDRPNVTIPIGPCPT